MVNSELTVVEIVNENEKQRIARAHSIGPRVISWLEQAGYTKLEDFAHETPENISFRVEIATGSRRNENAMKAYANLIELARNCAVTKR